LLEQHNLLEKIVTNHILWWTINLKHFITLNN
jgi:hypothetical protein